MRIHFEYRSYKNSGAATFWSWLLAVLGLFSVPLVMFECVFLADLLYPYVGEIWCLVIAIAFHIGILMLCRRFEVRCALLGSVRSALGRELTKEERSKVLKNIVRVTENDE